MDFVLTKREFPVILSEGSAERSPCGVEVEAFARRPSRVPKSRAKRGPQRARFWRDGVEESRELGPLPPQPRKGRKQPYLLLAALLVLTASLLAQNTAHR